VRECDGFAVVVLARENETNANAPLLPNASLPDRAFPLDRSTLNVPSLSSTRNVPPITFHL
jgi:hypothetical protein